MNQQRIYEFGPFRLDAENFRLLRGSHQIKVEPRVYDFLLVLVEHAPQTATKEELLTAVWKDANVEESNLAVCVTKLRRALGPEYIETVDRRGYRLTAEVKSISGQVHIEADAEPGPPNGALIPGDPRYVIRPTDEEFCSAVQRRDSIVVVKGARQVGKSSLLARALQQARGYGYAVVQIDLQRFSLDIFLTLEKLLFSLANEITDQLNLEPPRQSWESDLGPSVNMGRFLERRILEKTNTTVVCGLDELDRLLDRPYANDFFGLVRSWHNARALAPGSPWSHFTLAMALATEPHLFIKDLNQSPFNVGTRLTLNDFDYGQVEELNCTYERIYGSSLDTGKLTHYFDILGGHPYLLQSALYAKVCKHLSLEELEQQAEHNQGPFGEHLNRMFRLLKQDTALWEGTRSVLEGKPSMDLVVFHRLRSAGVLIGNSPQDARLRCELYARYLRKRLSQGC